MAGSSRRRSTAAAVGLAVLGAAITVAVCVLSLTTPARFRGNDPNLGAGFILVAIPLTVILGVGVVLATRRPENPVGWLLQGSQLAIGVLLFGAVYSARFLAARDLPSWPAVPIVLLETVGWSTVFPTLFVLLPLYFPDGRLIGPRWRIAPRLAVATMVFTIVSTLLPLPAILGQRADAGQLLTTTTVQNASTLELVSGILSGPVSGLFMLALIVAAVVSVVIRYRRGGSELRHQLKWFVAALVVAALAVIPEFAGNNSPLAGLALGLAFTVVPVAIAIAVLRYRLYDIDVIISRALVYGVLAALITAVYVGIVVGVGTLVGGGGRPNLALSIIATAVVAAGFQPARERLQRLANRLVYGRRATPYEVLSELAGRVGEAYGLDEVLPRMAQVLRDATGASHATVWRRVDGELRPAATAPGEMAAHRPIPIPDGRLPVFEHATAAVPVERQGEVLGALTVARTRGDPLTPVEERLLADLASQAALVFRNAGLAADLERRIEELRTSRQQLVAAQDAERQRLERNLHDGAQQHLVAMKVKLGLAETMAGRDPARAAQLIEALESDAEGALDTLRDLARGIYPAALVRGGLAAALDAQARVATLPVSLRAEGTGRFPPEVEAAVYFCCLEALQNIQKYARATAATITLEDHDGALSFAVEDNGRGFDVAAARRGAGMSNMADRVAAAGGRLEITSSPGGTRVAGSIPLAARVPA